MPEAAPSLLIQQTEIWLPTTLGWILLLGLIGLIGLLILKGLYPFLAVHAPLNADLLVVDGWLPDYALEQVYAEFQTGRYQTIVTVGTAITQGYYLIEHQTHADIAAATLIALGVPASQVVAVSVSAVARYRTYNTAAALKQWFDSQQVEFINLQSSNLRSINLCTLGAHARRSRLLFRRMLSPKIKVGVISLQPVEYDPNHWWQSSAGGRVLIGELIGYLYARLALPWIMYHSNSTEV